MNIFNLRRFILFPIVGVSIVLVLYFGILSSDNAVASGESSANAQQLTDLLAEYAGEIPAYSPEQRSRLIATPKDVWKSITSKQQFHIMWEKGTERPFSSDMLKEDRPGVFVTAGCRLPVFKSEHKFKSGTGWPSFWEVFDEKNIILKDDYSWRGVRRVEVLSACGEHLGHIFTDGPKPTGLRYCINSLALEFVPQESGDVVTSLDKSSPE